MSHNDRDRYFGDACYEVWRHGGNPDRVDADRCMRAYEDGVEADRHAAALMREHYADMERQRDAEIDAERMFYERDEEVEP